MTKHDQTRQECHKLKSRMMKLRRKIEVNLQNLMNSSQRFLENLTELHKARFLAKFAALALLSCPFSLTLL